MLEAEKVRLDMLELKSYMLKTFQTLETISQNLQKKIDELNLLLQKANAGDENAILNL
ncbi:MAG: hypothetical protein N2747_10500 [Chitinophagaceae bacterium]|nr:hypothetical protein [Chitinophagaceae bacterium]